MLALAARWERRAFCFIYPRIIPHLNPSVNSFSENFSRFFQPATWPATFSENLWQKAQNIWDFWCFFLNCIVFNEKFDKKSSILDIYKSSRMRYNTNAVGGTNTTAPRTTVTSSLRSIKLMISTRKHAHGCAFFIQWNGIRSQSAPNPVLFSPVFVKSL